MHLWLILHRYALAIDVDSLDLCYSQSLKLGTGSLGSSKYTNGQDEASRIPVPGPHDVPPHPESAVRYIHLLWRGSFRVTTRGLGEKVEETLSSETPSHELDTDDSCMHDIGVPRNRVALLRRSFFASFRSTSQKLASIRPREEVQSRRATDLRHVCCKETKCSIAEPHDIVD